MLPPHQLELPDPPDFLTFGEVILRFDGLVPGLPSRELVPAYEFRIVLANHTNVGHLNFRVGDTDHILLTAGHIGYGIRQPFRGQGYARQACQAIAPFVRRFYEAVIITCDPDNHASRRTIEKLGADFLNEMPVPLEDPHYQRGSHRKRRYRWMP